ncbi:hypothetical protein MHO82_15445 [Vibrio sp. Of7-15]|uniref:hypothetical protein n=1 Tax=Vibrio sp. Of7-15 TaxID=2724879 RepID=UPI001EF3CB45|nr:hypothetical protein [Vibrio sp. Of7-15]MCG7498262.1 hypothetical protein [Vibrio sp. Of7-15]
MSIEKDLIEHFSGLDIPKKLLSLLRFDNEVAQSTYFSEGFEFSIDRERFGLKTYSEHEAFLDSIYEFACADGSGSSYGFWLKDGNANLDVAPIVTFGSEGGFHVVANNFNELLQILTFDSEPMIDWDEVDYFKDPDDFEPSEKSKEYREWLKRVCGLEPISNANDIVKKAQQEHKTSFDAWVANFYEG